MRDRDIYALARDRTYETASAFLDRWAQGFRESRETYEFPEFAREPEAVYFAARELIAQLIVRPGESYSLYWENGESKSAKGGTTVTNAMLFFTPDGGMVAGLTIRGAGERVLAESMRALAESVEAQFAYWMEDAPPAGSTDLFRTFARTNPPPRLFHGELIEA